MFPLSVTTNILRHPKLPLGPGTSTKAAPTVQVSLSNVNAQRETTCAPSSGLKSPTSVESSCIPFPSQPIQCSRISASHVDLSEPCTGEGFDNWLVVQSPPSILDDYDIWRSGLGASQHVSSSFVHRNVCGYPPEDPFNMATDATTVDGHAPAQPAPRKRKMAVRRVKVPSLSSPSSSKGSKRTKRTRSSKKNIADVQFTATLHRSILVHLRDSQLAASNALSRVLDDYDSDDDYDSCSKSMLRIQDQILVERLWKALVDQGFSPSPFSPKMDDTDAYSLRRERIDHIFQTEPISLALTEIHAMDVDTPATALAKGSASPPVTQTSNSQAADVLTLSQLVATLILRHRDRSSTRYRSQSSARNGRRPASSPLSHVVRFHAHRGRK